MPSTVEMKYVFQDSTNDPQKPVLGNKLSEHSKELQNLIRFHAKSIFFDNRDTLLVKLLSDYFFDYSGQRKLQQVSALLEIPNPTFVHDHQFSKGASFIQLKRLLHEYNFTHQLRKYFDIRSYFLVR